MGFGTIVANIIMFIAVLMLASSILLIMNVYVQETQESLNEQKNRLVDELRTAITIDSVSYDNSTNTLTIYSTNIGTTNLQPETVDLYIDGIRISRASRSITLEPDTLVGGPTIWNPREVARIETSLSLEGTVLIRIVTSSGVFNQELISI